MIRVSGKGAVETLSEIFQPADNQIDIIKAKGYTLIFFFFFSQDGFIDQVLVSVFRAPHSYTGEEMVEISCHASPFIQHRIIEILIEKGVETAAQQHYLAGLQCDSLQGYLFCRPLPADAACAWLLAHRGSGKR